MAVWTDLVDEQRRVAIENGKGNKERGCKEITEKGRCFFRCQQLCEKGPCA